VALIERPSTPTGSVQDRCSIESRGSRGSERPSALDRGEHASALARRVRSWTTRVRASAWAPVLARGAGILVGMLGLATIGAIATARGVAGHPIVLAGSGAPQARVLEQSAIAASPRSGEPAPSPSAAAPETKPASAAVTEDGKVILNLATADDLQRLPGVGRKRAETILELRAKLGGKFRRLSDLLRIRGIGTRRLKQLAPLVVLDAKETAPPSTQSKETQSKETPPKGGAPAPG
jgi:competence protein ComEA